VGIDAGTVYSSVRIRLESLDNDLKGVFARMNALEGAVTKAPAAGLSAFKKFTSFIASSGLLPFVALSAAVAKTVGFMKESIDVSIAAQETFSKFGTVFGGIKDRAQDAAKAFADSFGLAGVTAQKLLGDTGDLLTGMGATQNQALDLSVQVNTLAADLASFTNIEGGAERASKALTSAMLGEREQAKMLGIVIREVDVQSELASRGQDKLTGEAKLLATAQATLAIAARQSKNAIGDYARTAESAANVQKRAAESTKNLQVALGTALNPVATITASLFTKIADAITVTLNATNKLREASDADKKGNATIEQKLLLINEQIDSLTEQANRAESLGLIEDTISRKKIESLKAERTALVDSQRYQKIGTKAEQDAADKAEQIALKKKANADALQQYLTKVADRYIQTEEGKIAALRKELAVWEEYAKTASSTAPQVTAIIGDIKGEIEKLIEKTTELTDEQKRQAEEIDAGDSVYLTNAQDKINANQELIDMQMDYAAAVLFQNTTEAQAIELQRKMAIAKIEAMMADREYKDAAIASANKLFDLLSEQAAFNEFKKNVQGAMEFATSAFGALSDLLLQLAENDRDAQLDALEEVQAAETQALEDRYDALTDALDAELQAKLYAAGLAEAETLAQLQAELEAAKATGDAELIAEAEDALERATLEEEYAAKKKALAERQAAEAKALEEKQAKEKAEIQYKYELASWNLKLLGTIASAAQAVVNGLMTQPFVPAGIIAGATAAALGGLQVAAVAAAKPVLRYETGGIVPGSSYSGDSIQANVNSGEMILTAEQQAQLLSLANGSGAGGGMPATIVLQLDGRVIAKTTVQLVNDRQFFIKAESVL